MPGGAVLAEAAPSPWRPLLALGLLLVIWGLSVPVMKLALRDVPPLAFVSLRYAFAAPFFALFLVGQPLPSRRGLARMAALAVLGLAAGQVLQIAGIQRSSAVVATIITATIPIFTVLLAGMRLGQPVRLQHLIGLAVALAGVALCTLASGTGDTDGATASGDVLLLLSSVCIAGYYVFGVELARAHGVMAVSAWSTIFCAVLLSPLAVWQLDEGVVRWTPIAIGVLAYVSLLVTVVGIWIWLHALRALPVRIAASSQYVQPLIGICASAAIFGSTLGIGFAAGAALVLAGIALTSVPRHGRMR